MSLSGAASAMGIPEELVERSAAARAAESGVSVDEILSAWAGGEVVASPPSTPAPEPEQVPEPVETGAQEPSVATPEIAAPTEAPAPVTSAAASYAPVPSEVTVAQAAALPDVITVPTAGIRERTNFSIPRWLTALMLIAPLFALFALSGSATGKCGEGTELATNVISGEIVNCDGSAFVGASSGGGGGDQFIQLGGELYMGNVTPAASCHGCHGDNGEGSSAFPSLTGVLTTFKACSDHMEWVRLGTMGFQAAGRTTYGDTAKPVGGVGNMPSHSSLTEEQLASVVAYERVRFGGADPTQTLIDCGLTTPPGGDGGGAGQPGTGDTTPPTGGSTTTTTPQASIGHLG